jgi:predicted enzyme related to lactoylglutathione lyase
MGERTSYTPGTFCWTDLATSDADGAKRFYGELFGWDLEDQALPEGGAYTVASKDGKTVAALYPLQAEGQPPAWASYVTVESADDAAARAGELGAIVISEPFDVMDIGRMAVVQDPTGAVVCVWEARGTNGAALVNGPGALSLNQLNTSDPQKAREFYEGLFGWRFEEMQGGDQAYWGIYNGDAVNGGMMEQPPSMWLVYFGSESVDDDAERIGELGGQVVVPPAPVPGGRILVAQDPQGAMFALFAGRFDD